MIITALSLSLAAIVGFVAGWTARDRVETKRALRKLREKRLKPAGWTEIEYPASKLTPSTPARRLSLVPMQADEAPDTERSPGTETGGAA